MFWILKISTLKNKKNDHISIYIERKIIFNYINLKNKTSLAIYDFH